VIRGLRDRHDQRSDDQGAGDAAELAVHCDSSSSGPSVTA
jgi:hypothetical protein